jgi:hypothetical protein
MKQNHCRRSGIQRSSTHPHGLITMWIIHVRLPLIMRGVTASGDFMTLRLTTAREKGSAGILPAVAGHRALDDEAGRMPALPFSSAC